ncbi:lipopolysaccharide biosynthesis protein [Psychrobacter pulmonis]|uniref:lipopolysaccharide biosynthesis protein n=1 Tax=Psychrobacter pulmonis TaxID=228654 RepID=UPI001918BCAE|nr:oligosaccharide flippase family protein [Psychrobacter pulmonis]
MNKLKAKYNQLFASESGSTFKGMLTLALGSGAARIVGIASIPIVTRIYSPADYGLLALYISIVSILVPIATLRYSTAIPLPKTDALAINIVALGLLLIAIYSAILLSLLFLFSETILAWFDMAELAQWWWLIVLGVAGTASYELFSLWTTRKKQYKVMAKTQLSQSLIGSTAKIVLGLLAIKPIGLIIGQFFAQSAGIGGLIKASAKDFKRLMPEINRKRVKMLAIYYRDFPYFRLPSQLLLQVSSNAPILMMASLYSRELTGQLSLAIMAISIPTGLVGQSMAKAFYAEIAAVGKRDLVKVRAITIDVQKKLFLVGVPLTVLMMLLAEPLFKLVFGEEWKLAGKYATILAPFILLQLTSSPLMQVLNLIGGQLLFLVINIVRVLGLAAIFMLANNIELAADMFIILLSSFLFIFYLAMTAFIFHMINQAVENE